MSQVRAERRIVLLPHQQKMVPMCTNAELGLTTDRAEVEPTITKKEALFFTPAVVKREENLTSLQVINVNDRIYTINADAIFAKFTSLTTKRGGTCDAICTGSFESCDKSPRLSNSLSHQNHPDPRFPTGSGIQHPEGSHDSHTFNPLEWHIYKVIVNRRWQKS